MKLFKVWQDESTGYETYSDMVVCADDEEAARNMHPNDSGLDAYLDIWQYGGWCTDPKLAHVEYIGEARADLPQGIICSSYHAG